MKIRKITGLILLLHMVLPAISQQTNELIKNIGNRLAKGETTVSRTLADPSLLFLHSLTPFRELIEQHAKQEKIKLNSDREPGTRITVKGTITDQSGNLQTDKLVYVYQTSAEGWYADTAVHILQKEGDRRHARLFGYFKTGSQGEFEFTTIKPKSFPDSNLPAQIDMEIYLDEDKTVTSALQFDDDPMLTGKIRRHAQKEKIGIAKNSGTELNPFYTYRIQVTN